MRSLLFCGLLLLASPALAAKLHVRVVDSDGKSVEHFQAMWHTSEHGYSFWQDGKEGTWSDRIPGHPDVIDIIIRGDGYATTLQRFQGDSLKKLFSEEPTLTLSHGREVRIPLDVPEGVPVPSDFVMESYYPAFTQRVRSMRQPVNLRGQKPDFNMLNVKRVSEREFSVRLPDQGNEFWLAFQHPGWLRFCEFGPFGDHDIQSSMLPIKVPEPASLTATFDKGAKTATELPFDEAQVMVYSVPDESGALTMVTNLHETINPGEQFKLTDLGPGKYMVDIRTKPNSGVANVPGTEINPGQFAGSEVVVLHSGDSKAVDIAWTPFVPHAFRGDAQARIAILKADGTPAAGKTAKITWFDGHYGQLTVFDGRVPIDGIVALNGVSAKVDRSFAPFGPYALTVGEQRLGFFRLEDTSQVQNFEFRITPSVGDIAPDIALIDLESKLTSHLSDYRGKVVLLEFWSTGCGPCQPAMQKLNQLAAEKRSAWGDRVAVLSISTDRDPERAREHTVSTGWSALRHFVGARRENKSYFSDAETAFVVFAIPHAVLIDRAGKIAWRGHPADTTGGKSVEDRIQSLLD